MIVLLVLVSCVRTQPRGRDPPGPPPPEKGRGPLPSGGPGTQPTDNQGQPPFKGPGGNQGPVPFDQGPPPFDGPGSNQGPPTLNAPGIDQGPQAFDGPGGGPPADQPASTSGTQSTNPWQDLLTRMMDLLSSGVGPKNLSKVPAEIIDPKQDKGSGPPPTDLPPPPKPLHLTKQEPPVKDCFWEGQYYPPGSDIVRGQHDRWCYVTYCDSAGKIQFWDDYNCPPNSMRDTSSHSSGRDGWVPPGQRQTGGPPSTRKGCNHAGQWYEPNQDISSHRVGERCYGSYCSQDSQVVNWEDWCTNVNNVGATPSPGQNINQNGGPGRGQGQGQGTGGQGSPGGHVQGMRKPGRGHGGGRRAKPTMGCYHSGKHYQSK